MSVCVCMCAEWANNPLPRVTQKTPLRAPSTRPHFSTHFKASLDVVDGLVGRFEGCVRIAADFPHQWSQRDMPQSELLLEIDASLFVVCVFVVYWCNLDLKIVSPRSRTRDFTVDSRYNYCYAAKALYQALHTKPSRRSGSCTECRPWNPGFDSREKQSSD